MESYGMGLIHCLFYINGFVSGAGELPQQILHDVHILFVCYNYLCVIFNILFIYQLPYHPALHGNIGTAALRHVTKGRQYSIIYCLFNRVVQAFHVLFLEAKIRCATLEDDEDDKEDETSLAAETEAQNI